MAYPTRIRYGLRLLARLAIQAQSGYVSIADIASEEGVSVKYLEQIVGLLRPLGILTSVRGARGGYALVSSPAEVTLEAVFESLGGLDAPTPCVETPSGCNRAPVCAARSFWSEFDAHMRSYLRSKTLADLIAVGAADLHFAIPGLAAPKAAERSDLNYLLTPAVAPRKRKIL